ncbi:hypothetical protein [Paraburkholderia terrae]
MGAYVDRTEAERTTLGEALDRYAREVVPAKRFPKQEHTRIAGWKQHELSYRKLASLRGVDFAKYRDQRREPVVPKTQASLPRLLPRSGPISVQGYGRCSGVPSARARRT